MLDGYSPRMQIAEAVGSEMYRRANYDPLRPPRSGAVALAIELLGGDAIVLVPHARAESDLATVNGGRRVMIRKETPPRKLNFLVGRELGRWFVEREGWYLRMSEPERLLTVQAIGGWLVAPSPAVKKLGPRAHIGLISDTFACPWSCSIIRSSEDNGNDAAIATPKTLYKRGTGILSRLPDEDVRRLLTKPARRGYERFAVPDEQDGRIALLARTG